MDSSTKPKRAAKPNYKDTGDYAPQFKASDAKIELAVHHITDWEKLRDTWDRMVVDKRWGTIAAWLYAVGFDVNNIYYGTNRPQTPALVAQTMWINDNSGQRKCWQKNT